MPTRQQIMDALVALGDSCAGVDIAQIGAPEELPEGRRLFHVSLIDSPRPGRSTLGTPGGRDELVQNFLCEWEAQVAGDEEGIERALADFLDDWHPRFLAAQNGGGVLQGATWDNTLAASPEYRPRNQVEGRAYPFVVGVRVSLTRVPNP